MQTKPPIVLAAFGTSTRAMKVYRVIDAAVQAAFPEHYVTWAYTSRIVRSHMRKRGHADMKSPPQTLEELGRQGYEWAVVQSLHLICGHEFFRLVDEVKDSPVRISQGLPLLTAPGDYRDLAAAILINHPTANGTASVLVGHGTDHPAWTAYPALAKVIREAGGVNIYMTTIEGESSMEETVADVVRSGARHVHLIPMMLVAGVHLQEDIAGDDASLKQAFLKAGLSVTVETKGLGQHPVVIEIFIRHIRDALDIIPARIFPKKPQPLGTS